MELVLVAFSVITILLYQPFLLLYIFRRFFKRLSLNSEASTIHIQVIAAANDKTYKTYKADRDDFAYALIFKTSLAVGSLTSGVIYVMAFLPVCLTMAAHIGIHPLDLILFSWLPKHLSPTFFSPTFPRWSDPVVRPLVYSFGLFYGVEQIAVGFFVVSNKFGKSLDYGLRPLGLFMGFYLTLYAGSWIGFFNITPSTKRMLLFKFGYIFFSYYLVEAIKGLVVPKDWRGYKYEYLLDGFFALFTTIILTKVFGDPIAGLFSGPLFLLCTLLSMLAVEQIYGRLAYSLIATMSRLNRKIKPGHFSFRTLRSAVSPLWRQIKNYKGRDIQVAMRDIDWLAVLRQREFWRSLSTLLVSICLLDLLFPCFLALVYVLLIEGHF